MTTRQSLPYRGPCAFCGCSDARHRDVDAWVSRVKAGDDPESVAFDFGVPTPWVIVAALAQGWRQPSDPGPDESDHPFLPQIMQGRPHQCEECGQPKDAHSTEYDWANWTLADVFTMPTVVPSKRQVRNPARGGGWEVPAKPNCPNDSDIRTPHEAASPLMP